MMKKILLLLLAMLPFVLYAQEAKFEDTKEVQMSKDELYSKTKMFIAEASNDPKAIIQNDDKEGGTIQLKSTRDFTHNVGMGLKCMYTYSFVVRFRLKDNKYRIEIFDVNCTNAAQLGLGKEYSVPSIPYFTGDNVPETKKSGRGISEKKAKEMMNELNSGFSEIISSYNKYISTKDDF